jgi:hypothetical protein
MRRLRIPEMYALNYARPDPLVPRRLRLEVAERMGPDGSVRVPLDEASARAAGERLAAEGVEAVAVSLLHAYANPLHEKRVAAILRQRLGEKVFISCSSDILPVIREYERTSTTVINAYLGPTLGRYFESLKRHLAGIGIDAGIHVMKSDGGVMSVAAAAERPAYIVESGPAAGVIGAAAGVQDDVITFDMVLDLVGGRTHERSYPLLRKGGTLVWLIAQPFKDRSAEFGVRTLQARIVDSPRANAAVVALAAKGVIKAQVSSRMPLREAAEAHRRVEGGRASRGRIVLDTRES